MSRIILTYHRIGDTKDDHNGMCVSTENFEKHMSYISNKYSVLKMHDFLEYSGNDTVFAVTFDDGYESFIKNAVPVMEKYDIPSTVFAVSGAPTDRELWMTDIIRMIFDGVFEDGAADLTVGGQNFRLRIMDVHDRMRAYGFIRRLIKDNGSEVKEAIIEQLHERSQIPVTPRNEFRIMTDEMLATISQADNIEIGGHTVDHFSLGSLSPDEQKTEIGNSISSLERITGKKIRYFAYPFGRSGDYNDHTKELLKNNGVLAAFTTEEKRIDQITDPYAIPRFNCDNSGFDQWLCRLNRTIGCDAPDEQYNYLGLRERDRSIQNADTILIFGCGQQSRGILDHLTELGIRKSVRAFVDNDMSKVGTFVDDIPVDAFEEHSGDTDADWIVQNRFDYAIVRQLNDCGIKRIHWWI